jgi:heptose I phosphotransferase
LRIADTVSRHLPLHISDHEIELAMSTITETVWPDGFVELDEGRLKVHPDLVSHFRIRGWYTLDDVLRDSDVSVTEERDIRDNCTVELRNEESTDPVRVYLKRHRDQGRPHEASAEADAVEGCRKAGVACMNIAAVGHRKNVSDGDWHSFFMSVEVGDGKSAYDLAAEFCTLPADDRARELTALLSEVASVLVQLHRARLFHRDCYLEHFILESSDIANPPVKLIDLQGTRQMSGSKAVYAQIKDLEHLAHSMRGLGLSNNEIQVWYRTYFGQLAGQESSATIGLLIKNAVMLRGLWRRQKNGISRFKRMCKGLLQPASVTT